MYLQILSTGNMWSNSTELAPIITTLFGVTVVKKVSMTKGNLIFTDDGKVYLQDRSNPYLIKEIIDPVEKLEYAQYRF